MLLVRCCSSSIACLNHMSEILFSLSTSRHSAAVTFSDFVFHLQALCNDRLLISTELPDKTLKSISLPVIGMLS